ncbi:MAG: hypothetical protein V7636_1698, partial [Actinomycetota bacterium]
SAVSATAGALGATAVVAATSFAAVAPTAIPTTVAPTTTVVTTVVGGTPGPTSELGFTSEATYRSASRTTPSESPGTTLRVNTNGKVLPTKEPASADRLPAKVPDKLSQVTLVTEHTKRGHQPKASSNVHTTTTTSTTVKVAHR